MTACAPPSISDHMVQSAVGGDDHSRQQLFKLLLPQVRTMVNARLNPSQVQSHLAEDVVQEVMVSLTATPPQGLAGLQRRTVSGLRAFVSTVVARRVADAIRNKAGNPGPKAYACERSLESTVDLSGFQNTPLWEMLSASGASPLSQANQASMCAHIMTALGALKQDHRTVITLAFFDQLDTADIAVCMNLSRPAASMLLIRALKALRRNLTGSSQLGNGATIYEHS